MFTTEEMSKRIANLKENMINERIDLALVTHPKDIYYFSGTAFHSTLVVPTKDDPGLFVQINVDRAKNDSWLKKVLPSKGISTIIQYVREMGLEQGVIGIESDIMPVKTYQKLIKDLPMATFKNITPLILSQRMIKSQAEVSLIKQAAQISNKGFQMCRELIAPGKTEIEIRLKVLYEELLLGGELMEFRDPKQRFDLGVFASGIEHTTEISGYWMTQTGPGNSSSTPYGPTNKAIETGDIVCVNKALAVKGYHVDEARTFVVGSATQEQRKVFSALCRAQEAMVREIKAGVRVKQVYLAGWQEIDRAGYSNYFMTAAFYDFPYVGHGVGLEIDEPPLITPSSDKVLEEGMVLAIEPKIIIPGWGGMDLEDTLLVTESGAEVLTLTEWDLFEV